MKPSFIILHAAPNSPSGNPRRAFALYSEYGALMGAYDAGYRGRGAIPAELRALPVVRVNTSYREYKDVLSHAGQLSEPYDSPEDVDVEPGESARFHDRERFNRGLDQ